MTYNTGAAARPRFGGPPDNGDNLDRFLVAACAVIWLGVLGSAVAATVALVNLGRGHPQPSSTSGTPWLLYAVIGVSALVIIGAIPLLVRARRTALEDSRANNRDPDAARPIAPRTQATTRMPEPQTQQLRSHRGGGEPIPPRGGYLAPSAVNTSDSGLPPAVDRLWLRCSVVIACAMGIALLAIGIATYLMAAGHDTFAWSAYVIAGLVTLAMPAIPWIYLRQLHELMDASGH
jgi:hypothetical protein